MRRYFCFCLCILILFYSEQALTEEKTKMEKNQISICESVCPGMNNWWCVIYPEKCGHGKADKTENMRFYSSIYSWIKGIASGGKLW